MMRHGEANQSDCSLRCLSMRRTSRFSTTVSKRHRATALVALVCSAILAGCSSQPMASIKSDKTLPAGWVRYSYGALSVGAPRGWRIYSYVPLCPPPHGTNDVVIEFTETTPEAASCAYSPGPSRVIALGCLIGPAMGEFGSPSQTTRVQGRLLHRSDTEITYPGSGWKAVFLLLPGFSPTGLGEEIMSTVKPTGRSCR